MSNDLKSVPGCVLGLRESPRPPRCNILRFHKFSENRVLRLKNDFLTKMSKMRVFGHKKIQKIDFSNDPIIICFDFQAPQTLLKRSVERIFEKRLRFENRLIFAKPKLRKAEKTHSKAHFGARNFEKNEFFQKSYKSLQSASNDSRSVSGCVPGLRESPRPHTCIISTFEKKFENPFLELKNGFFPHCPYVVR